MNRRTIAILFFIVAVLILGAVGIIYINQQGSGGEPTPADETTAEPAPDGQEEPAPIPPPEEFAPGVELEGEMDEGSMACQNQGLEPVVVALNNFARGSQITQADMGIDCRSPGNVQENFITNMDEALGLYVRTDIYQGQTLTYDALINDPTILGESEYGPSSLIPPGFVAAARADGSIVGRGVWT